MPWAWHSLQADPPHLPHSPLAPGPSSRRQGLPTTGQVSEPGSLELRPDLIGAFLETWAPVRTPLTLLAPDRIRGLQARSPHRGATSDSQASPSPGRPHPPAPRQPGLPEPGAPTPPSPMEEAGTAAGGVSAPGRPGPRVVPPLLLPQAGPAVQSLAAVGWSPAGQQQRGLRASPDEALTWGRGRGPGRDAHVAPHQQAWCGCAVGSAPPHEEERLTAWAL